MFNLLHRQIRRVDPAIRRTVYNTAENALVLTGTLWSKYEEIKEEYGLAIDVIKQIYENITKEELTTTETKMARRRGRGSYRRRRSGRRYRRGGRRYRRTNRRVGRLYKRLKNKGVLSTEIKYRDDELEHQRIGSDVNEPPVITFTDISEGHAYQERIGAKIFARRIKIAMYFTGSNNADAIGEQYVRWVIVRDKVPDLAGTPPNLTEVFDFWYPTPTSNEQAQLNMFPFKHVNTRFAKRFQVLWTGMVKVTKDNTTLQQRQYIKKILRINKPVQYGRADSVLDRGPGQIYMYFYGNSIPASTTGNTTDSLPLVSCAYRFSFTDC